MALSVTKLLGLLTAKQLVTMPSISLLRHLCSKVEAAAFNEEMLKILVCPLTKEPLRYDREANELVSDTIGVAYPIKNGIPNLVPQDGRMLKEASSQDNKQDQK